jgi:hypothetical protein
LQKRQPRLDPKRLVFLRPCLTTRTAPWSNGCPKSFARSGFVLATEFLKTYWERLEEEICEQEGQTLADQLEGSEAVKAAKHVYDEAAKAAKQAYHEVVRPAKQACQEARAKAYAEARKRSG